MLAGGLGDAEMAQDRGQVLAGVEHPLSLTEHAHHQLGRVAFRFTIVIFASLGPDSQQVDCYTETPFGSTRTIVRVRLGRLSAD